MSLNCCSVFFPGYPKLIDPERRQLTACENLPVKISCPIRDLVYARSIHWVVPPNARNLVRLSLGNHLGSVDHETT